MFNKAGDIAAKIGTVLGNAFSGIVNIVKANFTPGGGGYILLEYFKDVTEEFEKFSGSVAGQKTLSDYFKGAAENSKAILGSVGAFVKEILKVGADPNIKVFFDTLKEGAPIFGDILKSANEAGPSLARLVVSILKFVKVTTDAGAIKIFFDTLNTVLTAINTLLENELVKNILNVIGRVLAFALALGTIGKIGGFGAKVLSGNFQQLGKIISAVLPGPVVTSIKSGFDTIALKGMYAFDAVKKGAKDTAKAIATEMGSALKQGGAKLAEFGKAAGLAAKEGLTFLLGKLKLLSVFLLTTPLGLTITAITVLAGLFVLLYRNSETFREAVQKAFERIKEGATMALEWLRQNWPVVLAVLTGPFGLMVLAIARNWDTIVATVRSIPQRLGEAGSAAWTWLTSSLATAWTAVQTRLTEIVTGVRALPGRIGNGLSNIWSGLTDGLQTAWKNARAWWNANVASRQLKIGGAKVAGVTLPSFTLGFPQLAEGGVISPSRGGTLAVIGEAGRSERVEPLDPQGLSKRDRAMIQMLAGGGGGGMTINVYPSPGMNESELASMVSRQIAFQLRRGGA
jgi:phage-related protein